MTKKQEQGFTLLELLVVMVIIGLLVSIVGPRYFGQLGKSEVKVAKAQIASIRKAVDIYRLDNGHYPDPALGLGALMAQPQTDTNWKGPYLETEIPTDPWQHVYLYRFPGEKIDYDIISLGADGQPGGADENADIVN